MSMSLTQELTWRGFVNQTTLKDITSLDKSKLTFYWGVDPSAASMTIGNLAAAMMVRHFIDHGHKAILLVGGATGLIGDPDGKAEERTLKTPEEIATNKKAIEAQYKVLFDGKHFEVVDNYDWFKGIGYLGFLRDIGKHVPMRQMLGRDFVQTRLSESGAGISYAEFSYVLIQAYDFLHLNQKHGVTLQLCGSDQWGNSIAGVDLIRRKTGQEAHVWSSPLVVNKATGAKFGKSEDGAIWLDEALTSVFKFYQFWLNVDDDSVEDYLKIFTLLSKDQIDQVIKGFKAEPAKRSAQKVLAHEVTKLVHGDKKAQSAQKITSILFEGGDHQQLDKDDLNTLAHELPSAQVEPSDEGILSGLVETGLATSKSEARRFVEAGAIYINNIPLSAGKPFVDTKASQHSLVVRRGKNTMAILKIK